MVVGQCSSWRNSAMFAAMFLPDGVVGGDSRHASSSVITTEHHLRSDSAFTRSEITTLATNSSAADTSIAARHTQPGRGRSRPPVTGQLPSLTAMATTAAATPPAERLTAQTR